MKYGAGCGITNDVGLPSGRGSVGGFTRAFIDNIQLTTLTGSKPKGFQSEISPCILSTAWSSPRNGFFAMVFSPRRVQVRPNLQHMLHGSDADLGRFQCDVV